MNLLLEGPDNAGKTTLARHIQARAIVAVEYFHPGGPPKDIGEEHLCMDTQDHLFRTADGCIVDRVTCISQQVYNPHGRLDADRQFALDELRRLSNLLIVYCRPSTDRLMRKEDFTWRDGESEEHKQKILRNQHLFIERYDAIMARVPHVLYDFDDQHAEDLRDLLVGAMNNNALHTGRLLNLLRSGDLKS